MNLTEMTTRVRQDLKDTTSGSYIWTDQEVQGAILRVVNEYSLACPLQMISDIATTNDDTELDISSLTGLLKIESIEFPIDSVPPYYQRFHYWAGRVFMETKGNGDNARVRWLKKHTLTASSTTIPSEHEEIIVLGATAYLVTSASAYTVDRAAMAGRFSTTGYRDWARERMALYEQWLHNVAQNNRITQRQLYVEE